MKIKDIRDMSLDELTQKNETLQEELFRLQIRRTSGQLDSPAMLKKTRRDIARIQTVLRGRRDQ